MKHPNIIKLLDVYSKQAPYFVVTEHVWGVSIRDLTTSIGSIPYNLALHILIEISEVLEYLRSKKIFHTSLQPDKIILNEYNKPMISPFELIKANSMEYNTLKVTYCRYLSPEIYDKDLNPDLEPDTYLEAVKGDQFSLGLLAYEMMVGKPLFLGEYTREIEKSRIMFFTDETEKEAKWENLRRSGCPPEVITLIKQMLEESPDDRLQSISNLSDELILLKPNLHKHQRLLLNSYNRCLAAMPDFSTRFYDAFFLKMEHEPTLRDKFKDLEKQKKMLQLAHRAFLESGGSPEFVDHLPNIPAHKGVTLDQYRVFIETLHEVAKEADPEWNFPGVAEAWEETKENTLMRLEKLLPNP
ncbi:MAG: protein kinase, partial [Bacteroidota bacterium]